MPILTVTLADGHRFPAESGFSLLDAALANGLTLEHSCKTGRCGSCKARVLRGQSLPLRDEVSLNAAEREAGWILTCVRGPATDLELDLGDLTALAGFRAKTYPCRIDSIQRAAPDVLRVELRLPPKAGFAFLPGQYIDVSSPTGIKRSYSIASDMREAGRLELHVRQVEAGAFSAFWFGEAHVNDLLRFNGPLGTFFLRDCVGLDLILLVTGTGYAPAHSILAQIASMPREQEPASVHLLWGGRVESDIYAKPSAGDIALRFTPVLSRADAIWRGARGHVQDVLLAKGPELQNAVVYACGSAAMIHSAREALIAGGLPPKRFFSDAFVSSN